MKSLLWTMNDRTPVRVWKMPSMVASETLNVVRRTPGAKRKPVSVGYGLPI